MSADADVRDAFVLIRDLARVSRMFQQESVYCGGVTFQQFTILDHVRDAGGELPLGDLHGLLAVEKSTTTRLLDPLVEKGFVAKAPSSKDARALVLVLTSAGKAAHQEYWSCMAKNIRRALGSVAPKQFAEMKEALRWFVSTVGGTGDADGCCR